MILTGSNIVLLRRAMLEEVPDLGWTDGLAGGTFYPIFYRAEIPVGVLQ